VVKTGTSRYRIAGWPGGSAETSSPGLFTVGRISTPMPASEPLSGFPYSNGLRVRFFGSYRPKRGFQLFDLKRALGTLVAGMMLAPKSMAYT